MTQGGKMNELTARDIEKMASVTVVERSRKGEINVYSTIPEAEVPNLLRAYLEWDEQGGGRS